MYNSKDNEIDLELENLHAKPRSSRTLKRSLRQKLNIIFSNISVEPVLLLYLIPAIMSKLTTQNLNLEKACRLKLQYSDDICEGLAARNSSMYNNSEEVAVQKTVASMYAWKIAIQSLLPTILILFLGSWSDRHRKRKPCMLLPLLGEIVVTIGLLFCTYFFYQLPMEWTGIVESVPGAFSGSMFGLFMGSFSYVSEVSSVETRTLRIGAVHVLIIISLTAGNALSGITYNKLGYYGVYIIALTTYIIGIVYGVFGIKESHATKENTVNEEQNILFLKDFFDWKHIYETFRIVCKNGKRNRRRRICFIFILVVFAFGPTYGESEVLYLFTRYRYQWDEVDFSAYNTYAFVVHVFGSLIGLTVFSKYLKMDDATLGLISCFSRILSCAIYALAQTPTIFYLGVAIDMFNGIGFIAVRSIISKLVPADELGQVNSLLAIAEGLLPMAYGSIYALIYKATINVLPGTFFFVSGLVSVPSAAIFFWFYTEHRKDARDEQRSIA